MRKENQSTIKNKIIKKCNLEVKLFTQFSFNIKLYTIVNLMFFVSQLILFIQTLALYKSFTYLLTYLLTYLNRNIAARNIREFIGCLDCHAHVRWNNGCSFRFSICFGVRQGAVLWAEILRQTVLEIAY